MADFLRVGADKGYSLPADTRKTDAIHFGDTTLFLGWYTGILATEHFLLLNGVLNPAVIDPSETLGQLHFALKALERLMKNAPDAFDTTTREHRDEAEGFFIRDDVMVELKYQFGVANIASDYIATDLFQKEESQDQLIHLLLGLALVRKFIPEDVCVQGISLAGLSRELASKICTWPSTTKWVIRNPYSGYKRVARGSRAFFFSYPIVTALRYIEGNESGLPDTLRRRYKFAWRHLMKYNLPCIYNPTNCHLALTLAAISNSWGENSLKHIFNLSQRFDWPVYPMLHVVFHHDLARQISTTRARRYVASSIARAEEMLGDAPDAGPSYDGSPRGWKAFHRFLAGTDAQNHGFDHHKGMRFSGVDFMLLHNIYQIISRILPIRA